MLSHKMDFYCCANRDSFHKSSHIIIMSIHLFYSGYFIHNFIGYLSLDPSVQFFCSKAIADSSQRTYQSALKKFATFCSTYSVITVGRIIFEDTQNFTLNKNFRGKSFEVMDNPRNFYRTFLARGDKMCDRFEDASVIRTIARHHIYKDILCPPLERHSRAEKNSSITNIVLLWLLKKMILNDSYYCWTCQCLEPFQYCAICFEERWHNFV